MTRRHARLREEIGDELDLYLSDEAVEEIDYARAPTIHEGHSPSYGAIIEEMEPGGQLHLPLAGADAFAEVPGPPATEIDTLRRLADGYSSFVWRRPEPSVLLRPVRPDEISLVRFQQRFGLLVVQRTAAGRVRLFSQAGIATFDGGRWSSRPHGRGYAEPIIQVLGLDSAKARIVRGLLDFCVHVLSPARVGATLIYPLTNDVVGDVDRSSVMRIPALDVTAPPAHGALKSLLSQVDRAVLVQAAGLVEEVGAGLMLTERSEDIGVWEGGTRHNSAYRYSAQQAHALVVVVSADGPVTVFNGGECLINDKEAIYVCEWVELCEECNSDGEPPGLAAGCEECDYMGYRLGAHYLERVPHREAASLWPRLF